MGIKKILKRFLPRQIIVCLQKIYELRLYIFYNIVQNKNIRLEKQLCQTIKKNKKMRVGFYVVYDASWGSRPLFEKMMNDPFFDVRIVVCPDTARGKKNQFLVLRKVFHELSELYGAAFVLNSFSESENRFIDYSDQFDVIGFANPYDAMTHRLYTVNYIVLEKKKLTFSNDYGYQGKLKYDAKLFKLNSYNMFWKSFVDNVQTKDLAAKEQYVGSRNIVISGSCKMDKLIPCVKNKKRKVILIAPHHTVQKTEGGLNLSNFLRLADFIQILPIKYPMIEFIFRPHPLLFTTLRKKELWGDDKVEEYIEKISAHTNVVYSDTGEYFAVFNESDAMIDDCGSFLAEYFYTKKPQCYILQSENTLDSEYLDFGKRFFNYVYKAFSEDDIYSFIDNVVIAGNDPLKNERIKFAEEIVMVNYPHVSQFIIDYFKTLGKQQGEI